MRPWQCCGGSMHRLLTGPNYACCCRVLFSPHAENVLASCSYDMTVRLWDVAAPEDALLKVYIVLYLCSPRHSFICPVSGSIMKTRHGTSVICSECQVSLPSLHSVNKLAEVGSVVISFLYYAYTFRLSKSQLISQPQNFRLEWPNEDIKLLKDWILGAIDLEINISKMRFIL